MIAGPEGQRGHTCATHQKGACPHTPTRGPFYHSSAGVHSHVAAYDDELPVQARSHYARGDSDPVQRRGSGKVLIPLLLALTLVHLLLLL